MASYYKKLSEYLKSQGCSLHRQGKGSHEIWYSPITDTYFPVPFGSHCKNKFTVQGVLKQAGVRKPGWL